MSTLVKSDGVRSGRKAKARHGHLGRAWESVRFIQLGHAPVHVHKEMKKQALETMSLQENGKSKVSVVVLCFMPIINCKYSQSNSIV